MGMRALGGKGGEPVETAHVALGSQVMSFTLSPSAHAAILALTKRINGGTHGLDDRKMKTKKFAGWLP